MAKSNTEHKMIKYLKPLEFFREFLNGLDEWPSPVLVGLYVSYKYVSLEKADKSYLGAHYYGQFPRDETLLDNLVEQLQRFLDDDNVLRGIIVASDNSVELDLEGKGIIGSSNNSIATSVNIPTLIDELCEKGNFESLKYTYFKHNMQSWRARDFEASSAVPDPSGITFPIQHRDFKASSAVHMLQVSLDTLNTLVDRNNV